MGIYPDIIALNNLPDSHDDYGLLGSGIKHGGMVLSGPVMDNSLCMLLNFRAFIKISHISFTARDLLWLQILAPLGGLLAPRPIGHIIGLSHPCTQRS